MEELKTTDFHPDSYASELDLRGIMKDSFLHYLIENLNCSSTYNYNGIENIMQFGVICDHDDGCICNHRLQWILNAFHTYEREKKLKRILK